MCRAAPSLSPRASASIRRTRTNTRWPNSKRSPAPQAGNRSRRGPIPTSSSACISCGAAEASSILLPRGRLTSNSGLLYPNSQEPISWAELIYLYPHLTRRLAMSAQAPTQMAYRNVKVGPVTVFYREAGNPQHPTLLLLHGFPTSSHMFRDLIPLVADRYHVVAPDLPGFGFSTAPDRKAFCYSFDNLAKVIENFTDAVGLSRYAIYVFDYGAPVGFRLAMSRPERVTAIVSQNGNAYEEGLSDGWSPIRAYWQDPSQVNRKALRAFLTPETTRWQYTHGVPDQTVVSPDGQNLDNFYLARPGADEVQLDLFG